MYIVDDQNIICPNFEQAGFDFSVFLDKAHFLSVEEFSRIKLEKRNEIVLINLHDFLSKENSIENWSPLLNTFWGIYFFYNDNKKLTETMLEQLKNYPHVCDVVSLPLGSDNKFTFLANQLRAFQNLAKEQEELSRHLSNLSQTINHLFQNLTNDYEMTKKIHKYLYPQRKEEIRGIKFSSKYEAGALGGGEFFDVIQDEAKIYIVFIHSESYLISSSLMGLLHKHKSLKFKPESFWKDAQSDISEVNRSKKKHSYVDIFILQVDLMDLSLKQIGESSVKPLIGQDNFSLLPENHSLSKGEVLLIPSVGYRWNWQHFFAEEDLVKKINEKIDQQDMELLNYLFYKLSAPQNSNQFKKDSTILMMEVNRHGIHQI